MRNRQDRPACTALEWGRGDAGIYKLQWLIEQKGQYL